LTLQILWWSRNPQSNLKWICEINATCYCLWRLKCVRSHAQEYCQSVLWQSHRVESTWLIRFNPVPFTNGLKNCESYKKIFSLTKGHILFTYIYCILYTNHFVLDACSWPMLYVYLHIKNGHECKGANVYKTFASNVFLLKMAKAMLCNVFCKELVSVNKWYINFIHPYILLFIIVYII